MKYFLKTFLFILIILFSSKSFAFSSSNISASLTSEEQQWLAKNKNRALVLGIDPYSGSEYFKYSSEEKGYLIPLIKVINSDLGINIRLEASKHWGEVYSDFKMVLWIFFLELTRQVKEKK